MTQQHAYFVHPDQWNHQEICQTLHNLALDEIWFRILDGPNNSKATPLLQLELYDLEDGTPVFVEQLLFALSDDGKSALHLSVDSDDGVVALQCFSDQTPQIRWSDRPANFKSENVDPPGERPYPQGEAGLDQMLTDEMHVSWNELQTMTVSEEAADVADESTALLLRGRIVKPPNGQLRDGSLHSFHETDITSDGEEDHLALIALEPKALEDLWTQQPAGQVLGFLQMISTVRQKVLGPLAHVLNEVGLHIEGGGQLDKPLVEAEHPELLNYEILAMSTAVAYWGGIPVNYFDERLIPLLSICESEINESALADALPEIEDLGLLSAMTEVLPYSAPEGSLLESFDDTEVAPLAPWAVKDDSYEGTLFLLNTERLLTMLQRFDETQLQSKANAFLQIWAKLRFPPDEGGAEGDLESWLVEREDLDNNDWQDQVHLLNRLRAILEFSKLNELKPALFFYGKTDE